MKLNFKIVYKSFHHVSCYLCVTTAKLNIKIALSDYNFSLIYGDKLYFILNLIKNTVFAHNIRRTRLFVLDVLDLMENTGYILYVGV